MANRALDDLNAGDVFISYDGGSTVTGADIVWFTCFGGLKHRLTVLGAPCGRLYSEAA